MSLPHAAERRCWSWLVLPLLACLLSCGYKSAASQRLDYGIKTVAVIPLENRTSTAVVEQFLTRELVHELVRRSGYRVIEDAPAADAVLSGTVVSVRANPVLFGRTTTLGSAFLVELRAQVEFKNRNTGQTIYRNNDYVFREQYQINAEVDNFFSEQNPALNRIAEDFAGSVVSSILEGF
ncbi:MAG TPA: LptE family protein [Acidobacteriota bacterium]|nr:LptE family protein [Acidobacteriota bacterium]